MSSKYAVAIVEEYCLHPEVEYSVENEDEFQEIQQEGHTTVPKFSTENFIKFKMRRLIIGAFKGEPQMALFRNRQKVTIALDHIVYF